MGTRHPKLALAVSLLIVAVPLALGLMVMWPFGASTLDLVVGTHFVDCAYARDHARMTPAPQYLPPSTH